jgi:curli biogenesis system outer membrane secretion channel CsgG
MTNRLCAYLLTLLLCGAAYAQQTKPRVAVMDFEYGTVQTAVAAWFGTNEDIGKGIRDLTVEKLVNGGKYSVIERAMLDRIMQEQNDSNSDRFDSNSAAKIGKLLGVDAIIVGSITKFGRDDQNTQIGGGAFSGLTGGLGGFGRKKATAVVAITTRVIDVNTAEILAVVTGNGESTRKSTSVGGGGRSGGSGGGGGVSMGASGFGETIIGEATLGAVTEVAAGLDEQSSKIQITAHVVEGLVADYAGGLVTLTVGSNNGVKAGTVFAINKVVREIKHPVTGAVIRRVEETVGTVKIDQVGEDWATGSFAQGAGPLACDSGDFSCIVAKTQ